MEHCQSRRFKSFCIHKDMLMAHKAETNGNDFKSNNLIHKTELNVLL